MLGHFISASQEAEDMRPTIQGKAWDQQGPRDKAPSTSRASSSLSSERHSVYQTILKQTFSFGSVFSPFYVPGKLDSSSHTLKLFSSYVSRTKDQAHGRRPNDVNLQ